VFSSASGCAAGSSQGRQIGVQTTECYNSALGLELALATFLSLYPALECKQRFFLILSYKMRWASSLFSGDMKSYECDLQDTHLNFQDTFIIQHRWLLFAENPGRCLWSFEATATCSPRLRKYFWDFSWRRCLENGSVSWSSHVLK